MKRAWYLPDKYPETRKDQSNSDWSALLITIWHDDGGIWRSDDMTNLVTMKLVLLWYKMQHRVGLVIQSLLLSTTQQPLNKPSTSCPKHANAQQPHFSICQWGEHHH